MTEQKAIELLRFAFPKEITKPITEEVISMAVASLEKQIPKKPRIESGDLVEYYYCSVCDKFFGRKGIHNIGLFDKPKYCDCGQKIDWNDESEEE